VKLARSFPPEPGSARAARRFVLDAVGDVPPPLRDAISVMVSELAMNAVQHARTNFQVAIELTPGSLRVEVTDSGGGTPASQPMPPPSSPQGRGLPLVQRLADQCGIIPARQGSGKSVWFEIGVQPGADALARCGTAGRPGPS